MNRFLKYLLDKTYTYSVCMEPSECYEYLNEKCTAKDKEQTQVRRRTFMRYPFEVVDPDRKIFKIGIGGLGKGAVLKGQIEKKDCGSKIEVRVIPRSWIIVTVFIPIYILMGLMGDIAFLIISCFLILLFVFWNWLEGRMYLKLMDKIIEELVIKD